jgi:Glycosyltransferase family 87
MMNNILSKKISIPALIGSIVLALVLVLLIVTTIVNGEHEGVDFDVFLAAARNLLRHQNIYTAHYINNFNYFYSPFFALLLTPFCGLPDWLTESAWLLFSFYLSYRIWIICRDFLDDGSFSRKQQIVWRSFSFFFILAFLIYNINRVQITIFIVWGALEALRLFNNKRYVQGGLLLALVVNIKIMPVVFLPYLLYNGNWKALIWVAIFSMVYLYVPALFVGGAYNAQLLASWLPEINPANKVFQLETGNLLLSLNSAVPVFLTPTVGDLPLRRNFFNLDVDTAMKIATLVRLATAALTLAFMRRFPFRPPTGKVQYFWEISFVLLITPLIFPHQGKYAYFYLFPAFIYLVYFFMTAISAGMVKKYSLLLLIALLCSLIFTPFVSPDIIGGYAFAWLQFYRVLVICSELLIPVLLICSPAKIAAMKLNGRAMKH